MGADDWKIVQIGDIGRVITGRTPRTAIEGNFGDEYPFITPSDMDGRKRIVETERRLSEKGADEIARCEVPPKSVMVSCIGWQMGKVALTGRTSFTNQQINTIIPDEGTVVPDFLHYSLSTRREELKNLASVGTRTPILNKSSFEKVELQLPPRAVQRKIAAVLSAYDDLIENNTRRIAILEEMAQAIYREWFVHFRFPGHEEVDFVDTEVGEVPAGWELKTYSEICSKVTDGTHDTPKPADEGYYLVTGKNINRGFIDFSDCYLISPEDHQKVMSRSRPEKGDIIFSNIGTLGKTALVEENSAYSIKNVALFKPASPALSTFLYLHLSDLRTLERLTNRASGTSQRFLGLRVLRSEPVLVPPFLLLRKFNELVRPIIEQRSTLYKQIMVLKKARDLLLPRLVSGELDVAELEVVGV